MLASTSQRLSELPGTAQAMRDGAVNLDAARAISKAAERLPAAAIDELDQLVVDQVSRGANRAQVVDAVEEFVTANSPSAEAREAALWCTRHAWAGRVESGAVQAHAELDPVGGDRFLTTLQALSRPTGTDDERTQAQRMADALVTMADLALAAAGTEDHDGVTATVSVHVALADLVAGEGTARLGAYGPTTAASARIVGCDANVSRIVMGPSGQPVDVGRASRAPTAAQRRAVRARDRTCVGCGSMLGLHVHHIRHWVNGGPSDLDNLVLLCFSCHNALHRLDWTVRWDPDGAAWVDRATERRPPRHPR